MCSRILIVGLRLFSIILFLATISEKIAVAQVYTITDLGTLGGSDSRAFGSNDAGQVVGVSNDLNENDHAFIWDPINGMQELWIANSIAYAINNSGQVVGNAEMADGSGHAVIWEVGIMQDLGTLPGATDSIAYDINDLGQVVGESIFSGNPTTTRAFIWDSVNGMQNLGTLGGSSSIAFSINNSGQVVGVAEAADGFGYAFLWDPVNGMQNLGTLGTTPDPGASVSEAVGINDAGQVVGWSYTGIGVNRVQHAFLWDQVSGMQDIGTLPGGNSSVADSINNGGHIVGASDAHVGNRAFLWEDGLMIDPDIPPGASEGEAWNINSAGDIVGFVETVDVNGDEFEHAVLWQRSSIDLLDPVPTLLSGSEVTTDTDLLATQGILVQGVTADGVAQVVLRIPTESMGEQLVLTIFNDQNVQSTLIEEDGALGEIGQGVPQESSITVSSVDTPVGPIAFALYLAPVDFARSDGTDDDKNRRYISIKIENVGNPSDNKEINVRIQRPPVVLIHGIWSNPNTWDFFEPLISDPHFYVTRIDYEGTNAEGFLENAAPTLMSLRGFIDTYKSIFRVADVQADVVVHSMGGDIARTWVLLDGSSPAYSPSFLRPQNYLKGEVHKLITLDTPHLGSELANNLLNSNVICKLTLASFGFTVGDAVSDLAVDSNIIVQDLQQPIFPLQAHAIVGTANTAQTTVAEQNYDDLELDILCPSLLPSGGFQQVFGGPSDLIVSETSQEALNLGYSGGSPPSSNVSISVIHAVDPRLFTLGPDVLSRNIQDGERVFEESFVPDMVINLLNQPVTGNDFGPILP